MAYFSTGLEWRLAALNFGADQSAGFLPSEQWLTLRNVSRDPFSMNSVMIITGLPAETQSRAAVSWSVITRKRDTKLREEDKRRSGVHSCDQPFSLSPCDSLGDYMACRHQSHWQLLISPLHKCQEIIRMDQSTGICVWVSWCVRVYEGASWDLMNTNQPQGEGGCGQIAVHLHLHECVCVCTCAMKGCLTDGPCALWSPAWHLVGLTND